MDQNSDLKDAVLAIRKTVELLELSGIDRDTIAASLACKAGMIWRDMYPDNEARAKRIKRVAQAMYIGRTQERS